MNEQTLKPLTSAYEPVPKQYMPNLKTSDFSGIKELCDTKEKEKGVFEDREKNLGSHKTYVEAQEVDLFYSIAFFNKTNAKFPSSVLLFCCLFLYFLAITIVLLLKGLKRRRKNGL